MRSFMILTEELSVDNIDDNEEIEQDDDAPKNSEQLLLELEDAILRLRSHTENEDTDEAYGIEMGMNRAADLIETILLEWQSQK